MCQYRPTTPPFQFALSPESQCHKSGFRLLQLTQQRHKYNMQTNNSDEVIIIISMALDILVIYLPWKRIED